MSIHGKGVGMGKVGGGGGGRDFASVFGGQARCEVIRPDGVR